MIDLVNGLKYIHSLHIIHRDLKPENIFIRDNDDLVIGDFGYAVESSIVDYKRLGTKNFMAPELYRYEPPYYSYKSDVYALGCIFYEMYNLKIVHEGFDETIKNKIMSNEPLFFERPEKIERLENLINRMTEFCYDKRIGLFEVENELNIIRNENISTHFCRSPTVSPIPSPPSPSSPSYSPTNKYIAISENMKRTKSNNVIQPKNFSNIQTNNSKSNIYIRYYKEMFKQQNYNANTNKYNNKYSTAPLPFVTPPISIDNNNMNKTQPLNAGCHEIIVNPVESPPTTRIIEGSDVYIVYILIIDN